MIALTLAGCHSDQTPPVTPVSSSNIAVYFSPNGGCTDAVAKALEGAKQTVLVQAYSFTSAPIAKALVGHSPRHCG
jgi:hypothetical protein